MVNFVESHFRRENCEFGREVKKNSLSYNFLEIHFFYKTLFFDYFCIYLLDKAKITL